MNQIEGLRIECEKLQSANTELQRQRDQLEDEKEDIIKDKLRQIKENERWLVNMNTYFKSTLRQQQLKGLFFSNNN